MLRPRLQRLTAWLCLLATFALALAPAQALVVCCEPDGSFSLELAVAGRCAGCADECADDAGIAAGDTDCCAGEPRASDDAGCCPCVDIALPAMPDRPALASVPGHAPPVALPPLRDPVLVPPPAASPLRKAYLPPERPPPFLAALGTVVLLI